MKSTVTVYKDGEIDRQYDVVGFQKAVSSAMIHLCRFLDTHVANEMLNAVVECRYLARAEWSCTVTYINQEVFGLNVGLAK